MLRLQRFFLLSAVFLCVACSPSGLDVVEGGGSKSYVLTLKAGPNGSVTAVESGPYSRNQIVQVTATPDVGFQVGSWSGTMNDGATTLTNNVRMDGDKTVRVTFAAAIILSGNVTFTSIPATSSGLDYGSAADLPIRGAVIQIVDQSTSVIYSQGNLDSNGDYSLSAPANTDIRIIVQAAMGTPGDPHTIVVDNTDSESLYSIFLDMTTGVADTTGVDFNADSGWDGSDYTGTRAAGPFAILDVVYEAEQMVLAADATAIFPQLTINWSPLNTDVSGDTSAGEIGTSFYSPVDRALFILGDEDNDTDEYDRAIIAHEWSHYFEHQFSRSDSIGGPHSDGDILDPSVAMSEGFANALSGIIRGTNSYIDTGGTDQGSVLVEVDLEADETSDSATFGDPLDRRLDGYWSEGSISEVLYDIMDSNDDGSDDISLGFDAVYDALTADYKDTPAFTSIITFLHHLKLQQAASAASIDAIAADENISVADEFETANTAEGYRMYTSLTDGVTETQDIDGNNLTTSDVYEAIGTFNDNKLMHRRFFMMTGAAGSYEITIDPTETDEVMLIHFNDGQSFQAGAAGADLIFDYDHGGGDFVFAVGTFGSAGEFSVGVVFTPGGSG